jgi:hypothetical protein
MEASLGCRWCDDNFELPSRLWDHVQRKHPREFVQATTRPARQGPSPSQPDPYNGHAVGCCYEPGCCSCTCGKDGTASVR